MRPWISLVLPAPSTIVVLSLSTTTFLARPRSSSVRFSSLIPRSSVIALPPVTVAMSSSMAFRRSPKPGAFTAQVCSVPRNLLTTSVASASPSTSSAMIKRGLPARATCSSSGSMSFITLIFFSWMRTRASSSTTSIRSASVTKYGDRYPRSNCIPSTTSRVVSIALASSTVMTPSLPTFSIASAIRLPIVLSLFAAIVATWVISFLSLVALDMSFSSWTTMVTACAMPRCRAIGFAPAVTFLRPPRKMAWARTVAVVVPSPAMSEVLDATSFSIWAPMFSQESLSSISLATVTPSLVRVGLPNFRAMTTLRPFGPSVTLTARDMTLMPRRSAARASSVNRSCLGMVTFLPSVHECSIAAEPRLLRAEDAEDVLLLHDEVLRAVQLDLAAGILPEEDPVAGLDRGRNLGAVLGDLPAADGDHPALLRLFLGGVGDEDAAVLGVLFLETLDEHAVVERPQRRRGRVSPRANGCLSHGVNASLLRVDDGPRYSPRTVPHK